MEDESDMASIREIAERAKVAPGTVSRALNGKGYISKETREKIEQALAELEYVPNELARNLYRNRSNMIGVILPDIEHPFFIGIIKKLVTEMKKYGCSVVLWTTDYQKDAEQEYLDRLKCNVVDGVVNFVPMLPDAVYQKLGRPMVMFDRVVDGVVHIPIDQEKSGRLAAKKLYEDGCRQVLTVAGEESETIPSLKRHLAFIQEMEGLGGSVVALHAEWKDFQFDSYLKMAEETLIRHPEADGIYAADILGNAFLKVLNRLGKRVPEDFEIISTDGIADNTNAVISLSAVVQPAETIARWITSSLIGQIEGGGKKPKELIDVWLFEGDTTKRQRGRHGFVEGAD